MNDLTHFGILGMKWGVRRNRPDTSSEDHKVATTLKKKKLNEMSNAELKTLTARLQLEKQFKDLSKQNISPGKKFVQEMLIEIGKKQATPYVEAIAKKGSEALMALIAARVAKSKGS